MTRPREYTINPLGFLENAAVGFFTDAAVGLTQTVFNGVKTVADAWQFCRFCSRYPRPADGSRT